MENHPPETDIEKKGGTNNFTSASTELITKDINPNCKQLKNEDVKNANLGDKMLRKSVSWAEEEVLVETREIEICQGKKLSLRILERLCCASKSEDEKKVEDDESSMTKWSKKKLNKNITFIRICQQIEFKKLARNLFRRHHCCHFRESILRKGCARKMAEYSCSENQSIKDSVKSLKKYGSTCNHIKRLDYYVTHVIQKTDTLQGLALKYNTTTEQIRRINRLFASDSLFLRDHLKIPVTREIANSYETNNFHSGSVSDTVTSSVSTESFTDEDEKSINDLFGKIDNSIASVRAQVKQVQEHSSFLDSANTTRMLTKKHNKKQPHPTSVSSNNDVFVTPHPVVLNKGRKVKNSLQRLEKEQDELFEL